MVLERLDDLPRGALIALVVLAFILWWPVGLAMLGVLAFGRYRQGGDGPGRWYNTPDGLPGRSRGPWGSGRGGWGRGGWGCGGGRRDRSSAPQSGNRAFDEYRAETLRRLEDEQREFLDYLERLRQAKDKSEFDAFMADRRNRQTPTPSADMT